MSASISLGPRKGPRRSLVTSVRVRAVGTHDFVQVWSRGGLAGSLTVEKGDGPLFARILLPEGITEATGEGEITLTELLP